MIDIRIWKHINKTRISVDYEDEVSGFFLNNHNHLVIANANIYIEKTLGEIDTSGLEPIIDDYNNNITPDGYNPVLRPMDILQTRIAQVIR